MPNDKQDIFDVLDVSLREDTYTRLSVAALERSPEIRQAVFEKLTGQKTLDIPDKPLFRHGLGEDASKNLPDIFIKGRISTGDWWLVVEVKLMSKEGYEQTARYKEECDKAQNKGQCKGYTVIYLTLDGSEPDTPGWGPLSHSDWVKLISDHDSSKILQTDPVLSVPWKAYETRVRHYDSLDMPNEDAQILPWLKAPVECFADANVRTRKLAEMLASGSYESWGMRFSRIGSSVFLIKIWKDLWQREPYDKSKLLEDCVSIHYELQIPESGEFDKVICAVHCETYPYLTAVQLKEMPSTIFESFAQAFGDNLRNRIEGSEWKPRNHRLQKACCHVALDKEMTVSHLQRRLLPRLDQIQCQIGESIRDAAKETGLSWWKQFERDLAAPPHQKG